MNEKGLELITFAGKETKDVVVADDTVRISALAFAGSDVVRVKMPYTTTAIGHKAFYACNKLEMVNFGSYYAPNFEEEFDPTYYETFDHIPGSGVYGEYTDYDGTNVIINGMGIVPFYMWNVADSMYSNVFYGANFIDYIGCVKNKLTMVKPVNGVGYDSFICNQYFDLRIDGPAAPDDVAVNAINAIKAIPERVVYEDKAIVDAARVAYDKVATFEQKSLVINYNDLVTAEQRIKALTPTEDDNKVENPVSEEKSNIGLIILLLVIAVVLVLVYKKNKEKIQKVTKPVTDKIKTVTKPVTDKISKVLKPVTDKLKPVFDKVASVVKPVAVKVTEAVKKFAAKVAVVLKPVAKKVLEFAKKAGVKIVAATKVLVSKISVALKNAKEKANNKKLAKTTEVSAEPEKVVAVVEKEGVQENETEN